MKQILQSFKTGKTELVEIPAPQVRPGSVLIRSTRSLVSLGTERMLVEFGKANLVQKARQQPDKVKMVLDKIKADGVLPTLEAVFNKLGQPLPLGYCNVGEVIEVGQGVKTLKVGDRVASNGPHAEYVCVPEHLTASIPEKVTDEEAAFTVIGAIGLQGIRLAQPTLGETVVVVGLGLIGLITAQLLKANGCQVIGIDLDASRCELAESLEISTILGSAEDPVKKVKDLTRGIGSDAVIITASAQTDSIISQAAQMSRKRGRIILVGVIGLNLSRSEFYEKELTFQVSCSYGPGRYDDNYEQKGQDYPLPFVRWTEQRNFEAVLGAINKGSLNVKPLITEEVPLEDYLNIYGEIGSNSSIGSILTYPEESGDTGRKVEVVPQKLTAAKGVLGIIGSGNFTRMTLLPALNGSGASLRYIASSTGISSTSLAQKHQIQFSTTDYKEILKDPEVDTVLITTRHNQHAQIAIESLEQNKHVFVEKPLALTSDELSSIFSSLKSSSGSLMVGYNRRFSPHTQALKNSLGNPGSINLIMTMNAGFIPSNVWIHDMEVGGGRIVGEACHYMDLAIYLTHSMIDSVCMNALGSNPESQTDNASILLKHQNGSQTVINYFSNGSKGYSKERLEAYSQERTWIIDNFRVTRGYGVAGFKTLKTKQDKGHKNQFHSYIETIQKGGLPLINSLELFNSAQAALAAIQSLQENRWVKIHQLQ